jgi:hypothetical protein
MQFNINTTLQNRLRQYLFSEPGQRVAGVNTFMQSVINPETTQTRVADGSRLASTTKTILLTEIYDLDDLSGDSISQELVITWQPYDYFAPVKLYRISDSGRWVFMKDIPF